MWFYLFTLTLCLRLIYTSDTSVWLDEGYSLYFSQISAFEIIRNAHLDSNPPLGNVLFHYLSLYFDGNIIQLRIFGAVVSSTTSIVLFALASKLANKKIALYVVLLKAISAYDIGYATQLRIYPYAELA
jgi:hypothetical protein